MHWPTFETQLFNTAAFIGNQINTYYKYVVIWYNEFGTPEKKNLLRKQLF